MTSVASTVASPAAFAQGERQRMFRVTFESRGDPQTVLAPGCRERPGLQQTRPADGERAGLVENKMRGARQCFERVSTRDQQAEPRELAGRGRERHRRGQRQRAHGQVITSTATVIGNQRDASCCHQ